jgi:hypothetical protein
MFPPNSFSEDPFNQLKNRIRLRMKEDMVDEKMVDVVKDAFSKILRTENIILSRAERNRLLQTILKDLLNDILKKL